MHWMSDMVRARVVNYTNIIDHSTLAYATVKYSEHGLYDLFLLFKDYRCILKECLSVWLQLLAQSIFSEQCHDVH